MIKRSVPITLSVFAQTAEYAEGVKDGIMYTLECLMHECDVIMRKSPEVTYIPEQQDGQIRYKVRARFTVREKMNGMERGKWIKINSPFYEEEMNDKFDTDREWKGLTIEERTDIRRRIQEYTPMDDIKYGEAVQFFTEEALKEKNNV